MTQNSTSSADAFLNTLELELGAPRAFLAHARPLVEEAMNEPCLERRAEMLSAVRSAAVRAAGIEHNRQRARLAVQRIDTTVERGRDMLLELEGLRQRSERDHRLAADAVLWSRALKA